MDKFEDAETAKDRKFSKRLAEDSTFPSGSKADGETVTGNGQYNKIILIKFSMTHSQRPI